MDTKLIAKVTAGKQSHWHIVTQGGSLIAASIWGRFDNYHWVPSLHLACVVVKLNDCITGFLWADVVIVDYPENRVA